MNKTIQSICEDCPEECKAQALPNTIVLSCPIYNKYMKTKTKQERADKKKKELDDKVKVLEEIPEMKTKKTIKRKPRKKKVTKKNA